MKPTLICLVLAVCIFSCASPDTKTAPTGDGTAATAMADSLAAHQADTPVAAASDTAGTASRITYATGPTFFLKGDDLTIPPYGLEKIKRLATKILQVDDGESGTDSLDIKIYDSLTLREKFTYNVIHPESWSQNCDGLPFQENQAFRIYGTLPDLYGQFEWSDHQMAFFKDNRDSVQAWMKELVIKSGCIGENFREIIETINATGMIPLLAEMARKETQAHYSLTTLLVLMEKNQYSEYLNSSSYKKLSDHSYSSYQHPPYLVYNKANEDLIIQRATNFYNGLAAK